MRCEAKTPQPCDCTRWDACHAERAERERDELRQSWRAAEIALSEQILVNEQQRAVVEALRGALDTIAYWARADVANPPAAIVRRMGKHAEQALNPPAAAPTLTGRCRVDGLPTPCRNHGYGFEGAAPTCADRGHPVAFFKLDLAVTSEAPIGTTTPHCACGKPCGPTRPRGVAP